MTLKERAIKLVNEQWGPSWIREQAIQAVIEAAVLDERQLIAAQIRDAVEPPLGGNLADAILAGGILVGRCAIVDKSGMSIDLSKLTPAPWRHPNGNVVLGNRHADLDFIVLTRDVFDVMERRHWAAQHTYGAGPVEEAFGWYVNGNGPKEICLKTFVTLGDCWSFMVEADKLLAEREKANSPHAREKTA